MPASSPTDPPSAIAPRQQVGTPPPASKRPRRLRALFWIALPSLIAAIAVPLAMRSPEPIETRIDVTTHRATFHSVEPGAALISGADAKSVVLRGFAGFSVPVAEIRVADPAKFDLRTGAWPERAWNKIEAPTGTLTLRPIPGATSRIEIRAAAPGAWISVASVKLSRPARFTAEFLEKNLHRFESSSLETAVALPDQTELTVDGCTIEGVRTTALSSVTFRLRIPADQSRFPNLQPGPNGLSVDIELPDASDIERGDTSLKIDEASFPGQPDSNNEPTSALASGKIAFPEREGLKPIPLAERDILNLGDFNEVSLEKLEPASDGLHAVLQGKFGRMETGSEKDRLHSRVPSRFDVLRHNPDLEDWFGIVAWFAATAVAAWAFWRDLGKASAES